MSPGALHLRRVFVATALLAVICPLAGCAPAPPSVADAGPSEASTTFQPDWCKPSLAAGATATVVVGEGQTFYRDVPDGAELYWEKGPQGGHHVWIALRQRGLRMRGTIITVTLEDVEDEAAPQLVNRSKLVYDFERDEGYDPARGGWCTRAGLRMQLDLLGGVSLVQLLGHKVQVSVELRDPDGATATGSRLIVVRGALD